MKKIQKHSLFRKTIGCLLSASICFSAGAVMTGFPVRAAADNNYTAIYKLADSCQVGTILHCFSWKYDDIKVSLRQIASAGFTSIQVSPTQPTPYSTINDFEWSVVYQPSDFSIDMYEFMIKEKLEELCKEADKYGIKIIMDVVSNHMIYIDGLSPESFAQKDHWHNAGNFKNYANRSEIINGDLLGLRDLNTENEDVQTQKQ